MAVAWKKVYLQCISQVYFSNLLALWSFQWVLQAKMYFSADAVVSWTKASICSCRLRHQLQIDFITHSNPQLGIANANLMRTRNSKQVYIVFCRAALCESRRRNDSNTDNFSLRLFLARFLLRSSFLTLLTKCCLSAVASAGECSHKETETERWTNPRLDWIWLQLSITIEKNHFSSEQHLTSDHEATSSNQWHHYVLWHKTLYCVHMTIDKTDGIMETGVTYDGAILVR